jgi:hypothetical protein
MTNHERQKSAPFLQLLTKIEEKESNPEWLLISTFTMLSIAVPTINKQQDGGDRTRGGKRKKDGIEKE